MRLKQFALLFTYFAFGFCGTNLTTKRTAEDDYYVNYDYEISNNSINVEFKHDSLILPIPENIESKYTLDILPKVELPDDSLADTDLKDHDFIDNLMYVYYGSHNRIESNYAPEIIIIGSVVSCAAQLLTIFCILLKKNCSGRKNLRNIFLHLMCSFCISNLLFMLGIYATKNEFRCLTMALLLHYFHLLTAFWMFMYCFYIYDRFSSCSVHLRYFFLSGYGVPLLISLVSYLVAPQSYEIKRFCFTSVQKGMILNYMLPVSILLLLTTIYSLCGIRKINMELSKLEFTSSAESLNALKNEIDGIEKKPDCLDLEITSLRESKTCLKLLCLIQTGYDIVWFAVVIALENYNNNNGMSIVYAISSCLLNWYIFIKSKSFLPSLASSSNSSEDNLTKEVGIDTTLYIPNSGSSDNVPLLVNSENCTELRELHHEYISTISS